VTARDDGDVVRPYVMSPEEWEETFRLSREGGPVGETEPPGPGRLGERCPEHRELSERLKEVNDRSRGGGLR
jgi:hypothetical protein